MPHKILKILILGLSIIWIHTPNLFAQNNTLQFTTYYPSPSGSYSRLRLPPITNTDACAGSNAGAFYFDSGTNRIRFCNEESWGPIPGIQWDRNGDNVFLNATDEELADTFVGIGTNTPSALLEINYTRDDPMTFFKISSRTNVNIFSIDYDRSAAVGTPENNTVEFNANSKNFLFKNKYDAGAGPDETLFISNLGRIGIGTTAPRGMLHLLEKNGALTLEGANDSYSTDIFSINFRNTDDTRAYTAARIVSNNQGASQDGNLKFYTTQAGVNSEKMRITEDGYVGIGLTGNATSQLEIKLSDDSVPGLTIKSDEIGSDNILASFQRRKTSGGSSKGIINFKVNTSSRAAMPYINFTTEGSSNDEWSIGTVLSGTSGNLGFRIANNGRSLDTNPYFSILNNGNVGIGTTNPASELHIYENSRNTGDAAGLTIEQAGNGDAVAQFVIANSSRWVMGTDNSDGDKFKISSNANLLGDVEMVIDGDNNFGIGLADPLATLHVKGAGNKPTLVIISGNLNTTAPATLRVTERQNYYEGGFFSYNGANEKLTIGINRSASTDPSTDNDRIIIKNNGNVGIGQTNPSATLHVGGDLRIDTVAGSGGTPLKRNNYGLVGVDIAEFFPSEEGFLQSSTPAALDNNGGVTKANGQNIVLGLTPIQPAMLIEGSWSQIGPKPEDLIQEGKSPVALLGRVPVKYIGDVAIGDTLVVNSNGDVVRWQEDLTVLGYVGLVVDINTENKMAAVLTGHHGLLRVIDSQQEEIRNLKESHTSLLERVKKLEENTKE